MEKAVYKEENGVYQIDCSAAVWSTDQIYNLYHTAGVFLKDADFVTTQMRIGRLPARVLDERIPLSHGMIGQETNGAGGMFKAFRTIPVILDIVKDMQELCSNAWMINFTNPAGMVTEAVLRYTDFKKVIGLCNVPVNMVAGIANILGVEEHRVTMQLQGVNHHIFATDVFLDGMSVMDEVVER